MKKCVKCQIEKELTEFYINKAMADGHCPDCKECNKLKAKLYSELHRNERKLYARQWRIKNPSYVKEYRKTHKNQANLLRRERYKNDSKYREKVKAEVKQYRDNPANRSSLRKTRQLIRHRNKLNPIFRIICNLRRRMHFVLNGKRKAAKSIELIGCTTEQLKLHLESLFQPGMSWDNYGWGHGKWVIDHINPCKNFDLSNIDEQKKCFHYTNLQPLWFEINASKDHPKKVSI